MSDPQRDVQVNVKMSASELARLRKLAAAQGLNPQSYIRMIIARDSRRGRAA